jgi:glycosyltransferase involved in cell wall biosynthesis
MAVFASSCENLPIILLEKMAAGLPIICSNKGPMPEVLGSSGIYFDPEDYMNLSTQILKLIESRQLRTSLSEKSFQISKNYDWTNTSNETFKYLTNIILDNNNMRK